MKEFRDNNKYAIISYDKLIVRDFKPGSRKKNN